VEAKIIAIANQKGGCGKTTVTMQLAGCLGKDDYKILVVDADPQGTATRWAANASDELPFPAHIAGLSSAGTKLHQEVKKYINQYDYILIDCPPSIDSPIPQSALMISDLVLIPVVPSPADLWAAVGIQKLVENIQTINETLEARLVINMCQPQISLTNEVVSVLNDFGIKMLDSKLSLRTAYRQAAVLGRSVSTMKGAEKALFEIEQLKEEVKVILAI